MIDSNVNVAKLKEQLFAQLSKNNKESGIFTQYIKDYNTLLSKYLQLCSSNEKEEINLNCFSSLYEEKYKEIEILIAFLKQSFRNKKFNEQEKTVLLKRELANILHILEGHNQQLCTDNSRFKLAAIEYDKSIKQFEEMCGQQEKQIFELQGWNAGLKQENELIKEALNSKDTPKPK